MQKRYLLRKFIRAPFSRVGIQMMHVLLKSKENVSFDFFQSCPFLYSQRRVTSGYWKEMVTLCIPENDRSFEYLEKGLKRIHKNGYESSIHHIRSSGMSYCFDHYSMSDNYWNIPWELLCSPFQTDDKSSSMSKFYVRSYPFRLTV